MDFVSTTFTFDILYSHDGR